ncbi:MAG: sugar kinase [Proteobacteria bacterium]|nr:sugar kinase [Pseudomonadota bacterium]
MARPYDVVTLGETMIRLSPPSFQRLEQATTLEVRVGGAELSVAVGVARLGLRSAWLSKLPDNPLGRMVANKAREHGVDVSHVIWTKEGRMGLYFVEFGAQPRASSVLYDRADSALSQMRPADFDWAAIFSQARLFHVSGITPALSPSCAEATLAAARAAREAGCTVSVDVNYRAKLWSEEEAGRVMTALMDSTDILITTEEDTKRVYRIEAGDYREVARELQRRFDLKAVAITLRDTVSVLSNRWSAFALAGDKLYEAPTYEVEVVDRLGAGDSFTAGFLWGYLQDDIAKGVAYGTAFSALKHSVPGDFHWGTLAEVEALVKGGGLRIQR